MKTKLTILFLALFNLSFSQNLYKFSAEDDLNSDRTLDKIQLKTVDYETVLFVNGKSVVVAFEEADVVGFKIIDVDKTDSYKEILVAGEDPGGLSKFKMYWFDGKQIQFMNTLYNPTFNGNGFVYDDTWESFWTKRDKYKLDKKTHQLTIVPQFAYYVGIKNIVVTNWFAIYSDKKMTKKLATLSKNSKIEILLCDTRNSKDENDFIYLVKSKTGLVGWVKADVLQKNCEGFNYAG